MMSNNNFLIYYEVPISIIQQEFGVDNYWCGHVDNYNRV